MIVKSCKIVQKWIVCASNIVLIHKIMLNPKYIKIFNHNSYSILNKQSPYSSHSLEPIFYFAFDFLFFVENRALQQSIQD